MAERHWQNLGSEDTDDSHITRFRDRRTGRIEEVVLTHEEARHLTGGDVVDRLLRQVGEYTFKDGLVGFLSNMQKHQEERERKKQAVGKEIAKRRIEMGITIEQLADKANLHPAFLIQLEGGEIEETIDASIMLRIAEALDTTIADLYGLPITRINKKGEFYRE